MFLTKLAELVRGGFAAEEIRMEVVNVCEIIVDEFWRAGEESTVKELRSEILQKLRWPIEAGEANSQLVGVWRRMWMLDPNSGNEKGKDHLELLFPLYAKIIGLSEEALELAHGIIESVKSTLPKILTVTRHLEDGVEEVAGVVAEALMLLCACSKTEEESVNTTALAVCMLDSRMF